MQRLGREVYIVILIAALMLAVALAVQKKEPEQQAAYSQDAEFAEMRYPYSRLSGKEQRLYDALYAGMSAHRETIRLPAMFTAEEYKHVYLTVRMQEPELFYVGKVYELSSEMREANIIYSIEQEEAEQMRIALEAAADRIIAGIPASLSEWERFLMIHDAIGEKCRYGEWLHSDDAYGCLVDGIAQCEGYSKAFLYVARRAGLEMMCVPGHSANGTEHVWNVAKIDGKYYNMDLTWDDDSHYGDKTAHICFAQADAAFRDHLPDGTQMSPPACTNDRDTFFRRRGLVLSEPTQLSALLQSWLAQQGGRFAEFSCQNEAMAENVQRELNAAVYGTGYTAYWDEARQAAAIVWVD